MPTVWWLRPESRAARVGAHRAVVWKRLNRRPLPARRSAVGVLHGPPKALEAAKPTSSSSTISTFGAPAGGRSGSIGGNCASRASSGASAIDMRSGIGSTDRSRSPMAFALRRIPARSRQGRDSPWGRLAGQASGGITQLR